MKECNATPIIPDTIIPVVLLTTVYPKAPYLRMEFENIRLMVQEIRDDSLPFKLQILIASAHSNALKAAKDLCRIYPNIPIEFIHFKTAYAGNRPEEISHCKEQLAAFLVNRTFDYLLFVDADVRISLKYVKDWIELANIDKSRVFIQIKYSLRSELASPEHTLGVFFHDKALLEGTQYWRSIFPKNPDGTRKGAPDCNIYFELRQKKCEKIVARNCATYHFLNESDVHVYRDGYCYYANYSELPTSPFDLKIHPKQIGEV